MLKDLMVPGLMKLLIGQIVSYYNGDTYRHGGVSQAPYESLNLAFHVGDEPKHVR